MIQLQVLSKILLSNDPSLITTNNLNEEYFSDYKDVFNFIMEHISVYNTVPDTLTVMDKFNNFEVVDVSEPDSYLMKELKKDYDRRYLTKCFNQMREPIMAKDIEKATSIFMKAVEGFTNNNISFNPIDLLTDRSRFDAFVKKKTSTDTWFISTGFPALDADLGGGWDKEEELATIVARTNIGKTWVLIKCAQAAAKQGLNVGIYSGEMSANKVGYRFDTFAAAAANIRLKNGDLVHANNNLDTKVYESFLDELHNSYKGSLKVLTPNMINGPAGVNALRSFIKKEKLDILFIDQHSLLDDDKKAKNPIERAANISKDLKNLQVMCKIPIISVSQQNRTKNENGEVDSNQIAQSDRIGQDSTVVIFLERIEDINGTDDVKKKKDIMVMSLIKSRDTENGKKHNYKVNFNEGTFVLVDDQVENNASSIEATGGSSPGVAAALSENSIENNINGDIFQ